MGRAVNIIESIHAIENEPSSNAKTALLEAANADIQIVLKYTYEPQWSYYVSKMPAVDTYGDSDNVVSCITAALNPLKSRDVTGQAALDWLSWIAAQYDKPTIDILDRVLRRNIGAGISTTTINSVFPKLISKPNYMRCTLPSKSNMPKFDWSAGVYVQQKMDAMFFNATKTTYTELTTRTGSIIPPHIKVSPIIDFIDSVIDEGSVVHGELICVDKEGTYLPREQSNGVINSICKGDSNTDIGDIEIVAVVWDVIDSSDLPYKDRYDKLVDAIGYDNDNVSIVPTDVATSEHSMMHIFREYVESGNEGVVVKSPTMMWKNGDNKDMVKMKVDVDVDLEIIDFVEGDQRGKHADTFGSILCQSSCGLLKVAVSGFKDAERKKFNSLRKELIGGIMTVKANAVLTTAKGSSLFLPRFVEMRADKQTADSLESIKEQFDNFFNLKESIS